MITPGTILIAKEAKCPPCFQLEDELCPNDWMSVKHNISSHELAAELSNTGWTFFYMASAIRTTAFGFNRAKMVHSAMRRIISKLRQQKCNCLEVGEVTTQSLFGVPYINIAAYGGHLQHGLVYSGVPHTTIN